MQLDMIIWLVIGVLAVLIIIMLITVLMLRRRLQKFETAYLALQTFLSGKNLDEMLEQYVTKVQSLEKRLSAADARLERTETAVRRSIDRTELLRYNAFENMGSDLSFALAILNQEGDGVILSSIHSREESRVYAKPLIKGESSYNLSKEEQETITKALAREKLSAG